MLDALNIEFSVYIKSIKMCPANLLQRTQEAAILQAYTDWYEIQGSKDGGLAGLEPVTENKAKMADVEY